MRGTELSGTGAVGWVRVRWCFVLKHKLPSVSSERVNPALSQADMAPGSFTLRSCGNGRGAEPEAEQQKLLALFRAGQVQLLVSTSVAEEGLDVAECSVVVRMHGVRSFAAHIQSRGRVRASKVGNPFWGLQDSRPRLVLVVFRSTNGWQDLESHDLAVSSMGQEGSFI